MHSTHRPRRGMLKNGVLLWAALFLMVATVAWAQGHAPRDRGDHGRSAVTVMMQHLDLTEQQRNEVHDAFRSHHELMGPKAEELHEAKDVLAHQIHADVLDEGTIRDAAAAVAVLEADLAVSKAELFQEIKQILTNEQLGQLHALLSEHASEHSGPGLHMRHPAPKDE